MELKDVALQSNDTDNDLEALNDLSEQLITTSYLTAAIHGPHWALGLDGELS